MTERLRIAAVVLLSLGLAAGFWLALQPLLALVAAIVGLLWLVGARRAVVGRPALDALGLLGFCFLAADGLLLGLPAWLALLAVLSALAAWDLSRFARRLAEAAPPSVEPLVVGEGSAPPEGAQMTSPQTPASPRTPSPAARMERIHLARLGLVLGGGLVLGALGLVLRFSLGFYAALGIGLLAVIALSRVARMVNR